VNNEKLVCWNKNKSSIKSDFGNSGRYIVHIRYEKNPEFTLCGYKIPMRLLEGNWVSLGVTCMRCQNIGGDWPFSPSEYSIGRNTNNKKMMENLDKLYHTGTLSKAKYEEIKEMLEEALKKLPNESENNLH